MAKKNYIATSMVFEPSEMKEWDSRFKKMAAEFGAVKHSLEAKVFTYFGMVFLEFASVTFEFEGGMKIGHSGKDYQELENNITAVLKINQPTKSKSKIK